MQMLTVTTQLTLQHSRLVTCQSCLCGSKLEACHDAMCTALLAIHADVYYSSLCQTPNAVPLKALSHCRRHASMGSPVMLEVSVHKGRVCQLQYTLSTAAHATAAELGLCNQFLKLNATR